MTYTVDIGSKLYDVATGSLCSARPISKSLNSQLKLPYDTWLHMGLSEVTHVTTAKGDNNLRSRDHTEIHCHLEQYLKCLKVLEHFL